MIVVHIPYTEDTRPYADYCFNAMKRMASNSDEVSVALHLCDGPIRYAADNHSRAVGEAFKATVNNPDALHVICDSDTVVVMSDWDKVTRQNLTHYACMGTAYQNIGTAATGHGKKQTYKGKPNVEWLALAPGKPWHLFIPAKTNPDGPLMIDSAELMDTFGLPMSYQLLQDACWNFPLFLKEQGLNSLALSNVEARNYVALRGLSEHEEWHLNGSPFVVHQGKSRKNPFRETLFSRNFYNHCAGLVRPPGSS